MTEYLELVLLVAFTVSVTGFLITGAVHLALHVATRATHTGGRQARPGPWTSPLRRVQWANSAEAPSLRNRNGRPNAITGG